MENNEHWVKILIENQLYEKIKSARKHNGKEADELIKKYTEEFKETVLKMYPVEDIDRLIKSVFKKMREYEERNSR